MIQKNRTILVVVLIILATLVFLWFLTIITLPVKAQTIEPVSSSLIKVYETGWPYEDLPDEARRNIRVCFLGQVYEYGNDCNTIEDFFRSAFADDMRFNQVVLLVAYLNLQRNQLIFFYMYEDWREQKKLAI